MADKDFRWEPMDIPTFTMVPNHYLSDISPHLSGTEAKVMNYLLLLTYGWHRGSVDKTLDEVAAGSGVSRSASAVALSELQRVGLVETTRNQTRFGREANTYHLRLATNERYSGGKPKSRKATNTIRDSDSAIGPSSGLGSPSLYKEKRQEKLASSSFSKIGTTWRESARARQGRIEDFLRDPDPDKYRRGPYGQFVE